MDKAAENTVRTHLGHSPMKPPHEKDSHRQSVSYQDQDGVGRKAACGGDTSLRR